MTGALLKELCQIKHGGTPSKGNPAFWSGSIPWVSPKDMKSSVLEDSSDHISETAIANSATSLVPRDTILVVARSGILAHTLPVARAARPLAFNQDIKALLPNSDRIDPEYLYWFVRGSEETVLRQGVKKGATVHSLRSGFLENLFVPLPAREKQKRVAEVLSRAEGIVRLRREAQEKARAMIPALFLHMFGDPAQNPRGWPLLRVRDFVEHFEGGKNIQAGSEHGSRYRILKVSAVTSGSYIESESKPPPDGYTPPTGHLVRTGDLLFSRANTQELVGATAIVNETNGRTLLPDKLWRLVWREAVEPSYMHALFQSAYVRRELGKLSSGTSASMRNISQARLFELRLPIAPLGQQRRFSKYHASIRSLESQQSLARQKSERIFEALLAECFAPNDSISTRLHQRATA